jgi:hypothetical protein
MADTRALVRACGGLMRHSADWQAAGESGERGSRRLPRRQRRVCLAGARVWLRGSCQFFSLISARQANISRSRVSSEQYITQHTCTLHTHNRTTLLKNHLNGRITNKNIASLRLPREDGGGPEKGRFVVGSIKLLQAYLELVYLVTALVPSDTACLASSPGRSRRTAVWISRLVMVERLL